MEAIQAYSVKQRALISISGVLSVRVSHKSTGVSSTADAEQQPSIQETTADVCSASAAEDNAKSLSDIKFLPGRVMSNEKKNPKLCDLHKKEIKQIFPG